MKFLRLLALPMIATLVISCGDDPTLTATAFTAEVAENPTNGQSLGTVSIETSEEGAVYTLSNLNAPGAISIDATSGNITVADASLFDFETRDLIRANYTATIGDLTSTSDITINITDVEETVDPQGPTIWTGATLTFTKADGADENDQANQDRLTDNVWLTRAVAEGQLFNIVSETAADKDESPLGTTWAIGTTADIDNLTFAPFRETVTKPKNSVGTDLVMHMVADDIYVDVKLTSWSDGKGNGGFAYERSTPQ